MKVKPEPEYEPEPEPEYEPEPEPNSEYEPEPEPELLNCSNAQPEPNPDWETAKMKWDVAWEMHIYIFAIVFAVIAVAALYLLLKHKEGQYKKRCFNTVLILLLIAGCTRFICLVLDPYMSGEPIVLPEALHRVVFGLTLPCLLSAFSLIFLSLIQASKVTFIHRNLMNWKVIGALCGVHFLVNTVAELLVAYKIEARAILLSCYSYVCVWGLFLFIGFPLVGQKIISNLVHSSHSLRKKARKEPLLKVARIAYGAAGCGILLLFVQIYFMVDMYPETRQGGDTCFSDPWLWWTFQTVARITEILMCTLLLCSIYNPSEGYLITCPAFLDIFNCNNSQTDEGVNLECKKAGHLHSKLSEEQDNPISAMSVDSGVCIAMDQPETAVMQEKQVEPQEDQVFPLKAPTLRPLLLSWDHRMSDQLMSLKTSATHPTQPKRVNSALAALEMWTTLTEQTSGNDIEG